MRRWVQGLAVTVVSGAVLIAGATWGASEYYTTQHGRGCTSCHEMAEFVSGAHDSAHRGMECTTCHEDTLGTKLRHIRVHLAGDVPEAIRLRDVDVLKMTASCQKCHEKEYAGWHAGPHSVTYRQIFANSQQNAKIRLMNDCLRCHGMHYGGAIRDLVQPQDLRGPWHIVPAGLADLPTIPCASCHWIHSEGKPETRPDGRFSVAGSPDHSSLAFFDRRERLHFAAAMLAIPQVYDGAQLVKASADPRAGLCYQCHAPRLPDAGTPAATHHWGPQVSSGDDRTPVGVHEGLSCFACHNGHDENARASCKTCHPEMSNCGLDVEKMDTTYANSSSQHNIHWVKCADCHTHGIPRVKRVAIAAAE